MDDSSIKILDRLDIPSLERIKLEAEALLDQLAETENIILNKANTIFQILIVMLVSIVGYVVTQISVVDTNPYVFLCCIIFGVSISVSIYFLFQIIYPATTGLKGAQPSEMLQSDIFDKTKFEIERLLSNRICSLEKTINVNKENQRKSIKLFKDSVSCIFIGLSLIVLLLFCSIFL